MAKFLLFIVAYEQKWRFGYKEKKKDHFTEPDSCFIYTAENMRQILLLATPVHVLEAVLQAGKK